MIGPEHLVRHQLKPVADPSMFYDPLAPVIDRRTGVATWQRQRLGHGLVDLLKGINCLIDPSLFGKITQIEVELHAEELPEPERFTLEARIIEKAASRQD